MKVIQTVLVNDLSGVLNASIAEFVLDNIDENHFDDGQAIDFDLYDKEQIFMRLANMKGKHLAKVTLAGAELYRMIMSLDVKIHPDAFKLLAFFNDRIRGAVEIDEFLTYKSRIKPESNKPVSCFGNGSGGKSGCGVNSNGGGAGGRIRQHNNENLAR